MPPSFEFGPDPGVVGFDAGWSLTFLPERAAPGGALTSLRLGAESYEADIRVAASTNFRAQSFQISVLGLSDADYRRLATSQPPYVRVEIRLGWRDRGRSPLAALGQVIPVGSAAATEDLELVMVGRLQEVKRVSGEFRYRTELRGIDDGFFKLARTTHVRPDVAPGSPASVYARALCAQAGVPFVAGEPGGAIRHRVEFTRAAKVAAALSELAATAHGDGDERFIPMFLRDGVLHFGGAAPTDAQRPHHLSTATGLVEAKPVAERSSDELTDDPFDSLRDPTRLHYDLVLLGRPDIRPGDHVQLETDAAGGDGASTAPAALFGALGEVATGIVAALADDKSRPTTFRVTSATHHLSLQAGFTTHLRVEPPTAPGTATQHRTEAAAEESDEADRTAASLLSLARGGATPHLQVGRVSRQQSRSQPRSPAQRVSLRAGLEDSDTPVRAVRDPLASDAMTLEDQPYLTPFAFGRAGLVVPHYPGMRVLTAHYRGLASEAIVAGCLWPEGGEPDSEAGDWWLSLPTDVAPADAAPDPERVDPPTGKASHDLITGSGTRAIHVRGFRVTVGRDLMKDIGTRPDTPPADQIEIRHERSNARIVMDAEGGITIATDGPLTLEAGTGLTLRADRVDVEVDTVMEVKKR